MSTTGRVPDEKYLEGKDQESPPPDAPNWLNRDTPVFEQVPRQEKRDGAWKHDLFLKEIEQDPTSTSRFLKRMGVLPTAATTTTTSTSYSGTGSAVTSNRLKISNLHYEVSVEELRSLFGSVGRLEKLQIHYDASGRSTGIAYITFSTVKEAVQAMKQFNAVKLYGQPIIVTSSPEETKVATRTTTTTTQRATMRSTISPLRGGLSVRGSGMIRPVGLRGGLVSARGRVSSLGGRGLVGGGRSGLFSIQTRAHQTVLNSRKISSLRRGGYIREPIYQ